MRSWKLPDAVVPHCAHRQASGFVGLKNAGATCYMNAVFQQLFMQPSIRALVLGAKEEPVAERNDSTFYQLQASPLSHPVHHSASSCDRSPAWCH
jgi:uncharacterized UBP type Zn finger protein